MRTRDAITEHRPVASPDATQSEALCGTAFVGAYSFSFELPVAGAVTIGRGAEADLQLVGSGVSRAHAQLRMQGDRAVLEDIGSRNGTILNRTRLTASASVGHGDEIALGDARVVLLRRSALSAEGPPVRLRPAFVERVDHDIAAGRRPCLFVLELPEAWYSLEPAREVIAKLSLSAVAGFYNDHVLAFAVDMPKSEALTLVAATTRTLRIEGVEAYSGFADPSAGSEANALLRAALEALLDARESDAAETAQRPVVTSPLMVRLHEEARRVARSPISVLLIGETGVGKEVFARTIHSASGRSGPLVAVNAAALPEQLLESELFGHERGAFSGANTAKTGLIEAAHGGTLFLDEIGELPMAMQAKLLRVLEERSVRRVGATAERKVDIRVVAATNADLEQAVREKRFRSDLLYRLNGCVLRIPPLRERRGEIAGLADLFLVRAAAAMRAPQVRITPEAVALLERYEWPGNVRELRNVMERAVALCASTGESIGPQHLPDEVRGVARGPAMTPSSTGGAVGGPTLPPLDGAEPGAVRDSVREYERQRILAALDAAGGNQTKAAESLGLPRRTLAYKMARLGIRTK